MKPAQIAKNIAQSAFEPLETLNQQLVKPLPGEVFHELFGAFGGLSANPKSIAKEDLQRARDQQKLEDMDQEDNQKSQESVQRISASILTIKEAYKTFQIKSNSENQQQSQQVEELKQEVVKLAKASGVDTKIHLENTPQKTKASLQTIKLLTTIIKTLRIKAEESKSAKELVTQRSNAKRTTGMLAWVSGKQMKVHEQGTLQLQG